MSMMGKAVGQQEDVTVISNSKDMVDTLDRLLKELEVAEEKQTNFDRITASPETLAEFISKETIKAWFAQANSELPHPNGSKEWLEWLKQETTE